MNFVNCTPHPLNIAGKTFNPSGHVARVSTFSNIFEIIDDIPIVKNTYSDITDLPEPEENTIYIVSGLILTALDGSRDDVVAPDTSPAGVIRDDKGQVIGSYGFRKN